MKTARWLRIGLSIGVVASVFAAPAAAQTTTVPCTDESGTLAFNELQQWISAPERKIGNLGGMGQGDKFPSWDGTAPTGSFTSGAGGMTVAHRAFNPTGGEYDPRGTGHFEGTFTGCINNIAWDLYMLSPVPPAGGGVVSVVRLTIDGTPVYTNPGDPNPNDIRAPAEGNFYRLRFAFTNIHSVMSGSPADFQPLDGPHTVQLSIFSQYIDDASYSYVYDASEAPSHLMFNRKASLSQYTKIDTAPPA